MAGAKTAQLVAGGAQLVALLGGLAAVAGVGGGWGYNRMAMVAYAIANAVRLHERRGHQITRAAFTSMQSAQLLMSQILTEDAANNMLYAFVMYSERPSPVTLIPPLIFTFFKLILLLAKLVPSLEPRVANFIKGSGNAETGATRRDEWAFQVAANTEVMAFFVMWSRAAAGILSLSMAAFKPAMSAIMFSYFTMFRCVSLRNPRPRRAWQALRGVLDRGLAHPYTTRFAPSSITQTLARGLQELDTAVATLQQQAQLLAQHRAQ